MKTLKVLGSFIVINVLWTGFFSFFKIKSDMPVENTIFLYGLIVATLISSFLFLLGSLLKNKLFFIAPLLVALVNIVFGILLLKDDYVNLFINLISEDKYILIINIVLSSATALFSFIILVIKSNNNHTKKANNVNKSSSVNNNQNVNFSYQSPGAVEDHTNTISEKERILKLKEELNGIDFKNAPTLEQTQNNLSDVEFTKTTDNNDTLDSTQEIRRELSRNEEELKKDLENLNNLKRKKVSNENKIKNVEKVHQGPIDPYRQTILPRRNLKNIDPQKYVEPIGNTLSKFKNAPKRSGRAEVKLEEYKDKIFLGDSERIWQLTRKQDRSLLQKQAELAKQNDEVDNNPVIKNDQTEIIEETKEQIKSNSSLSEDILTIDWDDD